MDVNNFENFSIEEYKSNLLRLNVHRHEDLVGKEVYYSRASFGIHIVEKWDTDRGEYLLNIDGQRFYSNPFRIKLK